MSPGSSTCQLRDQVKECHLSDFSFLTSKVEREGGPLEGCLPYCRRKVMSFRRCPQADFTQLHRTVYTTRAKRASGQNRSAQMETWLPVPAGAVISCVALGLRSKWSRLRPVLCPKSRGPQSACQPGFPAGLPHAKHPWLKAAANSGTRQNKGT